MQTPGNAPEGKHTQIDLRGGASSTPQVRLSSLQAFAFGGALLCAVPLRLSVTEFRCIRGDTSPRGDVHSMALRITSWKQGRRIGARPA